MTGDEEDEDGDSEEDGDCQGGDSCWLISDPQMTPVFFFNHRHLVTKWEN